MANAGGLAIVLVAGLVALGLALGTIIAAIVSLTSKDARRGFRFGVLAIIGTMVAMVLSSPFWIIVLRGTGSHGEPIVYPQDLPLALPVVLESAALVAALSGTIRQGVRRRQLTSRAGSPGT